MIEFILIIIQTALNKLKPLYDRYIVRDILTKGAELPASKWFDLAYWKSLTVGQLAAVGSLAAFKIFTFPLGVWISSFSMVVTYPMTNLLGNIAALIMYPINIFILNNGLNEFVVNQKTMFGFALVMVGLSIGAAGWYLIYAGGIK